jgi:hypothetical protein
MPADRLMAALAQGLAVVDLAERPQLRASIDRLVTANLPPFMSWASPGNWRWHRIYGRFPDQQIVVLAPDGEAAAALNAVPIPWDGTVDGLPAGYDDALVQGTSGASAGGSTALCLLSISIAPGWRRSGLAELLIQEAKRRALRQDRIAVVGPLRPTRKASFPEVPIEDYLAWRTDAGQVFDPWLRLHLAQGASVLGIARRSLVIRQPRSRWASLPPATSPGETWTPAGALVPIVFDADDIGEYAEPNIWIHHRAEDLDCTEGQLHVA